MTEYKTLIPEISLKFKTGNVKKVKIASSQDAASYLFEMYDLDTIEIIESAIVIFFNRANISIGWMKISQGGITETVVDVKLILSVALKCGASGIILSHNHPSGNNIPSQADKNLTNKLKEGCRILDINLLDHIVITPDKSYFSFADEELI
jgi:DNA repair protein RadC